MSRRNASEYDVHATIDSFSTAILEVLENYSREVATEAKKCAEQVAEECRQEIAAKSPGNGPYSQSWKVERTFYTSDEAIFMVYNAKHYQLTHLLEYGHEKWLWGNYTGDRVKAFPHIRPAEEKAKQQLVERIKKAL